MGIQVEVCIQNCFPTATTDTPGPEAVTAGGISVQTWETWLQRWLADLAPELSPIQQYELSLRLTGDREIHALNATYRQIDKPTDVLAFAALEADLPPGEELQNYPLYLGDIIISVETAERQAQAQNHSLTTELAWLAAHGLLHLLGWDHPDEASLEEMLAQQQVLLSTVGLSVGAS